MTVERQHAIQPYAPAVQREIHKAGEWHWEDRWRDLPAGGTVPQGGTSENYVTGGWRSDKPIFDAVTCTHCLLCWVFCPDSAIDLDDGKVTGVAYDHCKGCGICAYECPKQDAMVMAPDTQELPQ
ncbi:ferredoxin [Candidatus Poribacteria bacterium]|nr:ferredoxin [Candidatus Poribacteria bacterium]